MKVKVKNMCPPRSGNPVANQFKILTSKGIYFQSYKSVVCFIPYDCDALVCFGNDWDYGRTTMKYLHKFLNDYCVNLPDAKSFKESVKKGIDTGLFRYDPNL